MFFYKLLNFFYNDRILGQASRKIGESLGSISRGPTPDYALSRILMEFMDFMTPAINLLPIIRTLAIVNRWNNDTAKIFPVGLISACLHLKWTF
jgi:hypothetical protein